MILEGALSVKSALTYQRRVIQEVILPTKLSKDQGYIYHLAKKHNIKVTQKDDVSSLVTGRTHGGVLAIVEPIAIDQAFPLEGLVLIVEGVDDPFNLGMIMRTAAISGFKTIITNTKDFYDNEATVVKSSAGMSEALNWIRSSNIPSVIEQYHKKNYRLICAQRSDASKPFDRVQYPSNLILAIGGEKRGLSKEILDLSFMHVVIEYPSTQRVALSAVSATSILTYHIGRQLIRDIL
jgi:23S rRNA (guanosine2251-2'-O)-methyltransferase